MFDICVGFPLKSRIVVMAMSLMGAYPIFIYFFMNASGRERGMALLVLLKRRERSYLLKPKGFCVFRTFKLLLQH